MIVETNKQWYAVYTRPRSEKKVTASLEKKKFKTYCPVNKVRTQWDDSKKGLSEPLFKSYVFIYASENDYASIKQTEGVINFVYWLDKPVRICNEEIDVMKKFLKEYDRVSIEKEEVKPTQKVRIVNGPLMMWEGNVVEIKTSTVKIMLPTLGYALIAEIRKENKESIMPLQNLKSSAV